MEEHIAIRNHLMDHNYILLDGFENNVEEVGVSSDEDFEVIAVPEIYQIIPGVQNRTRIYVDNLGFKFYKRYARSNRVFLIWGRQK
jgi:hypothetical protein